MKQITIREATENDGAFVIELMDTALSPYYGGITRPMHAAFLELIFQADEITLAISRQSRKCLLVNSTDVLWGSFI